MNTYKTFQEYIDFKKTRHGDKFVTSDLNPDFIPYFLNNKKVEVDFGYEKKRGTIGVTTGWKPCFLLMLTKRSTGSSYTIGKNDKVVKVIK